MSVNSLSAQDLEDAIRRLAAHKNFERANAHRTLAHRMGILAESPRFLPICGHSSWYTQIRIHGIKYLAHRLIYQAYHGNLQASLDVSHTVYIGGLTTRNINPRHMKQESNEMNQSRKFCFLKMRRLIKQ